MPLTLHPWERFYVIVGSSAAALTGLQFVVIATLVRDIGRLEQRLAKDAARRRRVTAIARALLPDGK